MSLELVSKAVALHNLSTAHDKSVVSNESNRVRAMAITLFWGVVSVMVGGLLLAVSKKYVHSDLLGLLGLLVTIVGTIVAAYSVISPLWRQGAKPAGRVEGINGLDAPNDTSPEGLPAPPASVTEQTTNILETEPAKAMTNDRSGSL
jgi:F0F1-type ATP synthase assembly protein I